MSLMATGAGSVRRGLLRLSGTIAGALLGFVMARWLPYDHFALCLFLGGITMLGVIAMQVSPHGLAWLFLAITSIMVLLIEPQQSTADRADDAYYRMFDVAIGVASAILMSQPDAGLACRSAADHAGVAPPARSAVACRAARRCAPAISVVIVLIVWVWLDLPRRGRDGDLDRRRDGGAADSRRWRLGTRHLVAERVAASLHRLPAGRRRCPRLPRASTSTSFVWWLAMIGGVVWIGMHIQIGRHGVGYLGTQLAFVYVITLVQGAAPPTSIMPGIDRFVGIAGGLGILMMVSLLLWPSDEEREDRAPLTQSPAKRAGLPPQRALVR